jgi:hypothetical protein
MEVHECAGEKSYSFFGFSLNKTCKCEHQSKDHKEGCCKDKKTIVKAEQKDKIGNAIFAGKKLISLFSTTDAKSLFREDAFFNELKLIAFGSEFPPGRSIPLHILYGVFLI